MVALVTGDRVFAKMQGNLQEVKARDGRVLAVTDRVQGARRRAAFRCPLPVDNLVEKPVSLAPV